MNREQLKNSDKYLEPSLSSLKEELDSLHVVVDQLFRRLVEAERLAAIDDLTGCMRRNEFFKSMQRMVEENSSNHLLICDIDKFKSINDTYGHLVGDEVLKQVSKILRDVVGEVGLLGRLGGEEFAVAVPLSEEKAIGLAEKIRHQIEQTSFSAGSMPLAVTISIGVSKVNTVDIKESYLDADKKLYKAKNSGRNKVCA